MKSLKQLKSLPPRSLPVAGDENERLRLKPKPAESWLSGHRLPPIKTGSLGLWQCDLALSLTRFSTPVLKVGSQYTFPLVVGGRTVSQFPLLGAEVRNENNFRILFSTL